MAALSFRVRQALYGAVCALVGAVLLYVSYNVIGVNEGVGWDVGAGITALLGVTFALLSLFLFFVPAVLSGK